MVAADAGFLLGQIHALETARTQTALLGHEHAHVVINAGAYSHTSIAILDALSAFDGPVMEVHVTNIHARESFRHKSYVSLRANGLIAGLGVDGYAVAVARICKLT